MASAIDGDVEHTGTDNASPVSSAGARATLDLIDREDVYGTLERRGAQLADGIAAVPAARGLPVRVNRVGSIAQVLWGATGGCATYDSCRTSDAAMVARVMEAMAGHGAQAAPRGLLLLGARRRPQDVDRLVTAFDAACGEVIG